MKNRLFYFLLVIVVIVVLLLKLKNPDESHTSLISKIAAFATKTAPEASTKSPTGMNMTADDVKESATEVQVSPEFTYWFENEAHDLENSSDDSKDKEANLLIAAEKLMPAEIQFLKTKAVNMQGPANNRIFAMYMLTLAPAVTAEALVEIVKMPLALQGDQQVHSPEETLAAQEKSLRRMAIDALIERTHKDVSSKDDLRSAIDQIADSSLRNYAEKKIERFK